MTVLISGNECGVVMRPGWNWAIDQVNRRLIKQAGDAYDMKLLESFGKRGSRKAAKEPKRILKASSALAAAPRSHDQPSPIDPSRNP